MKKIRLFHNGLMIHIESLRGQIERQKAMEERLF